MQVVCEYHVKKKGPQKGLKCLTGYKMFAQVIGTLAHKKAPTRGQSIKKPGAMAGHGVGGLLFQYILQ